MRADEFIQKYYYIRTKKGQLVPFKFNDAQNKFYKVIKKNYGKKPGRYIVLKARQLGISTFTEAMITYLTTNQFYTNSLIVAHLAESASKIYDMTKTYINNLPEILRPSQKYSNAKELVFDKDDGGLGSSIRVTVGVDSARGSTFRYAHLSELAFWKDIKGSLTSIMQAIPNENDTIVVIESTANGFNEFHQLWEDSVNGRNDFTPLFFPWYLDLGYSMKYSGFELSDYEKEIKSKYKLTNDQLEWRRWCIANNCQGDELTFRQEYPISPEEAFITSGYSVFDTEKVLSRLKHVPKPLKRGYFNYDYNGLRISNIRWVDDDKGPIKIYKEPKGLSVLGGDTAGDGADYFTAHVVNKDGEQVAVYHAQMDEDLYTKQIYCLGMYYHSLIGLEVNFSSYPTQELQRLRYPMLYVREVFDKIRKEHEKKFGFRTTSITRPIIIAQLVQIMRENIELINDENTLKEALTFVKINGKPQASEGAHDDLIMGLAITYELFNNFPQEKEIEEEIDDDLDFFEYGT